MIYVTSLWATQFLHTITNYSVLYTFNTAREAEVTLQLDGYLYVCIGKTDSKCSVMAN